MFCCVQGPKFPLDDVITIMEPKEEPDPEALLAQQAAAQAQAASAQLMAAPAAMEGWYQLLLI